MQRVYLERLFFMPVLMGTIAATFRILVRQGLETRYQILFFWLVALAFELVSRDGPRAFRAVRFVLSAIAIAAGAITIKMSLEGVPWGHIKDLF